ncbi:MAG: zinc ribbon domain-containing protein [Clostridia bacterium]|nr:zinc ribbon domain-containing protein [Clostridia bacterium]
MFCNSCGSQIPDGINFCNKCGAPVAPQTQAPSAPQPQAPIPPYIPRPSKAMSDNDATIIPPLFDDTSDTVPHPDFVPFADPGFEPEQNNNDANGNKDKKKKTAVIISVVAVLVVAIAVFCVLAFVKPGFLLKESEDKNDGKSTSASTVSTFAEKPSGTTNPTVPSSDPSGTEPTPANPDVDLKAAEKLADEFFKDLMKFDMKGMFENEIFGWDNSEKIIDNYAIQITGADSAKDAYKAMSELTHIKANDAEDFVNALFSAAGDYKEIFSSEYGNDYTTSATHTAKVITADEAAPYIEKTKKKIDSFSSYGVSSKELDWDEIESFVQVKSKQVISGNLKTEENEVLFIFGYIDGGWKSVYVDDNGDSSMCLYSLSFLENLSE